MHMCGGKKVGGRLIQYGGCKWWGWCGGVRFVDDDWVAVRRGFHWSTSWVVDVEGGKRRSCAADLWSLLRLLQGGVMLMALGKLCW
jgi:hypothetical protein